MRLFAAAGEEGPGMPCGQRAPSGDRVLQVGQRPRDRLARAGRQDGRGFAVAPAGADVRKEPVGERRASGVAERPVERAAQVGGRVVQHRRGGVVGDGQRADGPQRGAAQRHVGAREDAFQVRQIARRQGDVQGGPAFVRPAGREDGEGLAEFGGPGETAGPQGELPHAVRVRQGFEGRCPDRLGGAQRPGRRPPSLKIMVPMVADRRHARQAACPEILPTMTFKADSERYERIPYRRCGRSGLRLPAISLGLWHNFGDDRPLDVQRAILRRAFDLGVTHFDLANNYGPPYGSAETNFGRILREDLAPYRDEIIISTKAGYDMWPGPYGEWGSRKYLLASLDQSLRRMGVDYVDIFYSHRFDPETPLEETMGALDRAVRSGKALYAGISSYSPERTAEAAAILREMGTPLLIHQPSYSMLNRWIEGGLLDTLGREGAGCIAFSPLAQGMLTGKYLDGVPEGSRASKGTSLSTSLLTEDNLRHVRTLNAIAEGRGQSLAQMALAWSLRDGRVTSALIGASSVAQLEENLAALGRLDFTPDELAAIDRDAVEAGINIWAPSSAG
jgi:L-glyceraldehyde 3-phosphate reductase